MVLSSQSPRPAGGRGYTSSRRGGNGKLKAGLILLLAVALGWFLFFRGGDDAAPNVDGSAAGSLQDVEADDARTTPDPGNVLPTPAPSTRNTSATPADASRTDGLTTAATPTEPAQASSPSASINPKPPSATTPRVRTGPASSREAALQLAEGFDLIAAGNTVAGRAQLSALLLGSRDQLSDADAQNIRARLSDLNARLVFSPEAVPNDPATSIYVVQSGDRLGSIAKRYKVPYPFLELINGIDARRMQIGQSLKLVNGPIHARVDKSEFVMDLYAFGNDGSPAYLVSFPVGLGENDNTPLGKWKVAPGKVTNPDWRNPRTNEYFPADHPDNPIGEYWVPITGVEGAAVGRTGFGIHGTNEPESIGQNRSMGCVRLGDADIAMVYSMLEPGESEIFVVP